MKHRFPLIARSGLGGKVLLAAFGGAARLAGWIGGGRERRSAFQELARALEAFRLFIHAPRHLGLGADPMPSLSVLVERGRRQGLWQGLWLVEGLGWELAVRERQRGEPRGLLAGETARSLPLGALVPLHAGMGLGLAAPLLEAWWDGRKPANEVVVRVLELTEANAAPGCVGVAMEALGLMVRTLYPGRLAEVDAALAAVAPARRSLFWHGVGRAIYFVYPRALNGSGWRRAVDHLHKEPPDEESRRQARHGFAWPLLLVNLARPGVMEEFLRRYGVDETTSRGLAAGALIWHAWAGDDDSLTALLCHRPRTVPERIWANGFGNPVASALQVAAPLLARTRRCEDLFG